MKEVQILNTKVNIDLTLPKAINLIEAEILKNNYGNYICTTNPEFIIDAQSDKQFQQIINNAFLSTPDGVGVLLAADFLQNTLNKSFFYKVFYGLSLPFKLKHYSKVTGVSLVLELCKLSNTKNYSIALLGGWPKDSFGRALKKEVAFDLAQLCEKTLKKQFPNINIVFASSQFSYLPKDDDLTIKSIKNALNKAKLKDLDLIFVAYNHKNQEKWLVRNMSKIPVKVGIGVGGTLDYLSGHQKTPPAIFMKFHLEWLFRLLTQPWRAKRIFKAFPYFPLKVLFS